MITAFELFRAILGAAVGVFIAVAIIGIVLLPAGRYVHRRRR